MSMFSIPSAVSLSADEAATLSRMPDKAQFVAKAVAEKLAKANNPRVSPTPQDPHVGGTCSSGVCSVPSSIPSAVELSAQDGAKLGQQPNKAAFIAAAIKEKKATLGANQRVRVTTPAPTPTPTARGGAPEGEVCSGASCSIAGRT